MFLLKLCGHKLAKGFEAAVLEIVTWPNAQSLQPSAWEFSLRRLPDCNGSCHSQEVVASQYSP